MKIYLNLFALIMLASCKGEKSSSSSSNSGQYENYNNTPQIPVTPESPAPSINKVTSSFNNQTLTLTWDLIENSAIKYSYAIGTTRDVEDIVSWTQISTNQVELRNIVFSSNKKYFVKVRSHLGNQVSTPYTDYFFYKPKSELEWAWTTIADTTIIQKDLSSHSVVWTGKEMIVWGGLSNSVTQNAGAAYTPATNKWRTISQSNAPTRRYGHTATWTGKEMIIIGGKTSSETESVGAAYNPQSNTWRTLTSTNAPSFRYNHTATWTGKYIYVCGGYNNSYNSLKNCSAYDPDKNTWTADPTSVNGLKHSAAWTGSEYLSWGGLSSNTYYSSGNFINSTRSALAGRYNHTGIWTGEELLIWGGQGSSNFNDGALYNPILTTWRSMTTENAPSPRFGHSEVWTGSELIIWSGSSASVAVNNGGAYNPKTNKWRTLTTSLSQAGSLSSKAIWTGKEMIIWGGTYSSRLSYKIFNSFGFCGEPGFSCYGDTTEAQFAKVTTIAYTQSGKEIVYTTNSLGVSLWKDAQSDRVLDASGLDKWDEDKNGNELKSYTRIGGRKCIDNRCEYIRI